MPGRRYSDTGDPQLKSRARVALREQVRKDGIEQGLGCQHPRCRLPGIPIDWFGTRGRPASYVLDEIVARDLGGSATDPTNVRPVHHRCNSVAGVAMTNEKRRLKARPTLLVIDDW